ncbi:MAG: cob(I)yrinic acid a,c-diamide adenosyltransferase [Thermoplasmata archaeon]|nr:MAG: cob(I)yrinic acid a,c-diamide adenosyltransferase [Thermoplasmata archaeon]MCD6468574.1 cob(I)yrinic acid a,c-diamide adenosyltransferase [Thermoplasmata archaeon]
MSLKKGYIHIYTGNGKGKTTAALGLGLRAAGAGLKVYMIQFMKGRRYSEIDAVEQLQNFTIVQFGRDEFVSKENPEQIDVDLAQKGLKHAEEIIKKGEYDLVILDEINVAIDFNLVALKDVLKLVEEKPEKVELVLTGRYAPQELMKNADLVTEMLEIKHPFQKGVLARKGIDY